MYKITSNLNKRNVFLIISLIILPILLHINETNLRQYSSIEITYLFIFQLTICFGISLITIFLCLIFKKIKFQEFFICKLLKIWKSPKKKRSVGQAITIFYLMKHKNLKKKWKL